MRKEDLDDLCPDLNDVLAYMQGAETITDLLEKLPKGVWQACSNKKFGNYVAGEARFENGKLGFPVLCMKVPDENLAEFIAVAHTALPYYMEKLAAVEKERDAERAHNAVLRGALEQAKPYLKMAAEYKRLVEMGVTWDDPVASEVRNKIEQALSATPSDSADRVQKLVDVLDFILTHEYQAILAYKAKRALAEWRGE